MTAVQPEVTFGSTRIRYRIHRSNRVKTVAVAVDPVEGVMLTAPMETSEKRLSEIVHQKAKWILEKLKRNSELPPPMPKREFVSGESFVYLGRHYRLKVKKARSTPKPPGLYNGWLTVEVPLSIPDKMSKQHIESEIVTWYKQHATARLPERSALWAPKIGVKTPLVLIREQHKRWGSCDTKGQVRFNWRVIQVPMRLVDYVVAHELVHLRHHDHTIEFWALLGKVMPDYENRREALREIGRRVDW